MSFRARFMQVSILRRIHAGHFTEIHAGQYIKKDSCRSVSYGSSFVRVSLSEIHAGQYTKVHAAQFSCGCVFVWVSFMRVSFQAGHFRVSASEFSCGSF